jgi:putative colanic acid biosynthesis UDP-glucose lipid carrier transferase
MAIAQAVLPHWRLSLSYSSIPGAAIAIDVALIVGSAVSTEILYRNLTGGLEGDLPHILSAVLFVAVLFVATMRVRKLYAPARLMEDQARSVLSAWCGAFLILASGIFACGVSDRLPRGDILLFWAMGGVALVVHRAFWSALLPGALESGALRGRRVVSLSYEKVLPRRPVENLTRHGYHIVAHFHVPSEERAANEAVENAIAMCRASNIEEVVVFGDPERLSHLRSTARQLSVLAAPVTFVPLGPLSQLFQRNRTDIGDSVAIELQSAALSPAQQANKRVVDIVVSFFALVCLAPLMLLVAIAIKLDSEGPVFFRQTRHGFNGRPFNIYKFRSMTVLENGDVVRQAKKHDARVTRVGYWIRRFSIDELPQLLNVFCGQMSIVGPRPHASAHERYFTSTIEKYSFRHHVKSGITGWAQVCGARGETDTLEKMQKRVELDLWYISNWSVWLDFSIIIRTIFVVFDGENAH